MKTQSSSLTIFGIGKNQAIQSLLFKVRGVSHGHLSRLTVGNPGLYGGEPLRLVTIALPSIRRLNMAPPHSSVLCTAVAEAMLWDYDMHALTQCGLVRNYRGLVDYKNTCCLPFNTGVHKYWSQLTFYVWFYFSTFLLQSLIRHGLARSYYRIMFQPWKKGRNEPLGLSSDYRVLYTAGPPIKLLCTVAFFMQ